MRPKCFTLSIGTTISFRPYSIKTLSEPVQRVLQQLAGLAQEEAGHGRNPVATTLPRSSRLGGCSRAKARWETACLMLQDMSQPTQTNYFRDPFVGKGARPTGFPRNCSGRKERGSDVCDVCAVRLLCDAFVCRHPSSWPYFMQALRNSTFVWAPSVRRHH